MPTTTNFGWTTPADTDLVKDGALAIRTLGNGIDTSLVDLKGGTTGQVLSKASGTDLDFTWVAQDDSNAIQNAIIDAKGDLIVGTAADTPARLAVGTNGYVLTADSTQSSGVKWAAAAAGGKVLQVVSSTTTTQTNIASTTLTDTGITATITPAATSSKILVLVSASSFVTRSGSEAAAGAELLRSSTVIADYNLAQSIEWHEVFSMGSSEVYSLVSNSIVYYDSPSTTSATTYKVQARAATTSNSGQVRFQYNGAPSTITLLEIGA